MLVLSLQKQRQRERERERREHMGGVGLEKVGMREDDQEVDWGNCENTRVYTDIDTNRQKKKCNI